MVLGIKALKSRQEAVGDTVLRVKVNGLLCSSVANCVAICKVFSNDASTGLLFLRDIVAVTLSIVGEVASIIVGRARCTGDLDLSCTQLSVIEEEGSLGSSLFLEGDGGRLSLSRRSDLDICDLATEAEEVLDFLLTSLRTDVLNVNCRCRHDFGCIWYLVSYLF